MRPPRLLIALVVLFGATVAAAGYWLLSNRPGAALERYLAEARQRAASVRPAPPAATTFRATVCEARGCVLVEAGGMAFLFGAGEGTAQSLKAMGLLRPDIDAVLLPDLDTETVAGLPGLALAVGAEGRKLPLRVSGPPGLVAVVDGANLLGASDAGVRLNAAPDGEDQGLAGRIVLDTGVVAIRLFVSPGGQGRAYRVDFDGKSLVLAGCRAGQDALLAAARGTAQAAGIVMAGSERLAPGEEDCTDLDSVLAAAGKGRLAAVLIMPAVARSAKAAWMDLLGDRVGPVLKLGASPARMDLTGPEPRLSE